MVLREKLRKSNFFRLFYISNSVHTSLGLWSCKHTQ